MVMVKKRNGELVPFNPKKIESALKRAGASTQTIKKVIKELKPHLKDGMTTGRIFKLVFKLLNKHEKPTASKFNLKSAIAQLGPKGHHFETFIAHLLEEKGYQTQARQYVDGKCLTYEIDVIASKLNKKIIAECKFHNKTHIYSPIHDALYSYARFMDIASNKKNKVTHGMLVTNTRFSSEVIKYANCVGLILLGWKHPKESSLEKIIDKKSIYPITIIQSLTVLQKENLLTKDIVLVKELIEIPGPKLQKILKCGPLKVKHLKEEAQTLLK